jgi:hypothetical protein
MRNLHFPRAKRSIVTAGTLMSGFLAAVWNVGAPTAVQNVRETIDAAGYVPYPWFTVSNVAHYWWVPVVVCGCILVCGLVPARKTGVDPAHARSPEADIGMLPGYAVAMTLNITDPRVENRRYFIDSQTTRGARFSFYLSARNVFTFAVTDIHGEVYPIEIALGPDGIPMGRPIALLLEVGAATNETWLRIWLDGGLLRSRKLGFGLQFGDLDWRALSTGANVEGGANASMCLATMIVWAHTPSTNERETILRHLLSEVSQGSPAIFFDGSNHSMSYQKPE